MATLPVITLSRQYGSGGRRIGQELADALGIPFYDNELITLAAQESGFDKKMFEDADKAAYSSLLFSLSMYGGSGGNFSMPLPDRVYLIQSDIIRKLAAEGPCVIVGRCADGVLKAETPLLRVYISADLDSRCRRAVSEYGDSEENIKKTVRDIDKQRARYCQHYYDQAWEDADNYDLCLNSDTLGIEGCVRMICSAREALSSK